MNHVATQMRINDFEKTVHEGSSQINTFGLVCFAFFLLFLGIELDGTINLPWLVVSPMLFFVGVVIMCFVCMVCYIDTNKDVPRDANTTTMPIYRKRLERGNKMTPRALTMRICLLCLVITIMMVSLILLPLKLQGADITYTMAALPLLICIIPFGFFIFLDCFFQCVIFNIFLTILLVCLKLDGTLPESSPWIAILAPLLLIGMIFPSMLGMAIHLAVTKCTDRDEICFGTFCAALIGGLCGITGLVLFIEELHNDVKVTWVLIMFLVGIGFASPIVVMHYLGKAFEPENEGSV